MVPEIASLTEVHAVAMLEVAYHRLASTTLFLDLRFPCLL